MQVIIHHREPADGHGEDFRKFLESMLDPFFAVDQTLREEKRTPDTASDAVIPTSYRHVDKMARAIVISEPPGVILRNYPTG